MIYELPKDASLEDVVKKVNEIIYNINNKNMVRGGTNVLLTGRPSTGNAIPCQPLQVGVNHERHTFKSRS